MDFSPAPALAAELMPTSLTLVLHLVMHNSLVALFLATPPLVTAEEQMTVTDTELTLREPLQVHRSDSPMQRTLFQFVFLTVTEVVQRLV
jgi:hypothetical protein